MLTLIHAPQSRSTRILWLLEELGGPYGVRKVDIRRRDGSGARDPNNPHPDGKVPALLDGEALVTESAAIVLYLTDKRPEAGLAPGPRDEGRAAYLSWLFWYHAELEPALNAKVSGRLDQDPAAQQGYEAALARIDAALAAGPWLMGDRFTAVDLLIGSPFQWFRAFAPENAALDAWLARLAERPALARAQARDGGG